MEQGFRLMVADQLLRMSEPEGMLKNKSGPSLTDRKGPERISVTCPRSLSPISTFPALPALETVLATTYIPHPTPAEIQSCSCPCLPGAVKSSWVQVSCPSVCPSTGDSRTNSTPSKGAHKLSISSFLHYLLSVPCP